MQAELLYLDSSALVKLVVREPESAALARFLRSWPERTSSVLATVEVRRSIRRLTRSPSVLQRAEEVLAGVHLLALADDVLAAAALLEPLHLRTLDALHLASALSLGTDLGGFVAYDARLTEAARLAGLEPLTPS